LYSKDVNAKTNMPEIDKNIAEPTTVTTPEPTQNPAPDVTPEPKIEDSKDFANMRAKIAKIEKENEKLKKDKEDNEKKALEEQGKFKELYEQTLKEKEEIKKANQVREQSIKIEKALIEAGINKDSLEFITPSLVSQMSFDDSGNISNLDSIVGQLVINKPTLFSKEAVLTPAGNIGAGIANGKSSQLTMSINEALEIANSVDASLYIARKPEVDAVLASIK
jgi:hypothetical protein